MPSRNTGPGTHRIYVPVLGVRCEVPDFAIGPLRFVYLDKATTTAIRSELGSFIGLPAGSGAAKELTEGIAETIDALEGSTALFYECEGHYSADKAAVFSAALDALAFLRFLASFVFSEVQDPVIDFYGNYTYDFGLPYFLATMGGSGYFSGILRIPDRNVLVIADDTVSLIYTMGLDAILKLLLVPADRTEFQALVLRSLGWFSSASVPMRYENRLLNYVTCLEMFLSSGDAPIAQNVSEGTALFIADTLSARAAIAKTIKDFYATRSRISHSGQLTNSLEEVLALKSICKTFLVGALARHTLFPDRKAFMDYIQRTRLSGGRPF